MHYSTKNQEVQESDAGMITNVWEAPWGCHHLQYYHDVLHDPARQWDHNLLEK